MKATNEKGTVAQMGDNLKTANETQPQHLKEPTAPAHIENGVTFKERWRKAPLRWKSGVVTAACAVALAIAVPLGAIANDALQSMAEQNQAGLETTAVEEGVADEAAPEGDAVEAGGEAAETNADADADVNTGANADAGADATDADGAQGEKAAATDSETAADDATGAGDAQGEKATENDSGSDAEGATDADASKDAKDGDADSSSDDETATSDDSASATGKSDKSESSASATDASKSKSAAAANKDEKSEGSELGIESEVEPHEWYDDMTTFTMTVHISPWSGPVGVIVDGDSGSVIDLPNDGSGYGTLARGNSAGVDIKLTTTSTSNGVYKDANGNEYSGVLDLTAAYPTSSLFSMRGFKENGGSYYEFGSTEEYTSSMDPESATAQDNVSLPDWDTLISDASWYDSQEEFEADQTAYIYMHWSEETYLVNFMLGSGSTLTVGTGGSNLGWTTHDGISGVITPTWGGTAGESYTKNADIYGSASGVGEVTWKTAATNSGGVTYDGVTVKEYWQLTGGENNKETKLWPFLSVTYDANGGSGSVPDPEEAMLDAGQIAAPFTTKAGDTFTPPDGKKFAGWSTDSDCRPEDAVDAGTVLYINKKDQKIYAIWEDASDYLGLKYGDVTLDSTSALTNYNSAGNYSYAAATLADHMYSTTLPTGLTGQKADGTKVVLVGFSKSSSASATDSGLFNGSCEFSDSGFDGVNVPDPTAPEDGTKHVNVLYAVWDDLVSVKYTISDDTYTKTGSIYNGIVTTGADGDTKATTTDGATVTVSENIARTASKSGSSYTLNGATVNPVTGSSRVFRYWTYDGDGKLFTQTLDSSNLSSIISALDAGTTEIEFTAHLRPSQMTIVMDPNGGTSNSTTGTFEVKLDPDEGADTYTTNVETFPSGLPAAEKLPATFEGWKVDGASTTYGAGVKTFDTDDVPAKLIAQYSDPAEPVTVTFKYNGGTNANGNTNDTTEEGTGSVTVATLPTPTRDGYNFVGWSQTQQTDSTYGAGVISATVSASDLEADNTEYTSDATLYALWDKTVTVNYALGSGSTSGTITPVSPTDLAGSASSYSATIGRVNGDLTKVAATAAASTNMAFLGWTTDAAVTSNATVPADDAARTAAKAPTSDELMALTGATPSITYYANFGVKVTLHPQNGTFTGQAAGATKELYLYDPAGFTIPSQGSGADQVNYDGKTLVRWSRGAAYATTLSPAIYNDTTLYEPGAVTASGDITANTDFYAIWDDYIAITFEVDSAKGSIEGQDGVYSLVYSGNKFTSANLKLGTADAAAGPKALGSTVSGVTYTFDKWKSGSDERTANPVSLTYDGANTLYDSTNGWGDTRTYTAQFTQAASTHTITLYYNGGKDSNGTGSTGPTTDTKAYNSEYTARTDLAKDGSVFIGWTTDSSPTYNSALHDNTFTVTEDLELYAVYDDAAVLTFVTDPASDAFGSVGVAAASGAQYVTVSGNKATVAAHLTGANAVTATPTPKASPAGYEFVEWTGTSTGDAVAATTNVLTPGKPTGGYADATYTASFGYRITWDYNGGKKGTATSEQSDLIRTTDATTVTRPSTSDIEKANSYAVGWGSADNTAYENVMSADPEVTAPATYYLVWDDEAAYTYAISAANQAGGKITAGPTGKTDYAADETVAAHSDTAPDGITVTANTAAGYKFAYFTRDGSQISNSTAGITVAADSSTATLVPQKENGVYVGHAYGAVFEKIDYTVEYVRDDNATPIATFTASESDKTTFTRNVGDGFPAYAGATAADGTPAHTLGYEFKGWSYDGSTVITLPATLTATEIARMTNDKLTLYPVWEARTYTVNFANTALNPAKHEGLAWGANVLDATAGTAWNGTGGTLVAPEPANAADKDNYDFAGWYADSELKTQLTADNATSLLYSAIAGTDELTAAQTIYAKFTPAEKTVKFNGNGHALKTDSTKYDHEEKATFGDTMTFDPDWADLFEYQGHHIVAWAKSEQNANANIRDYELDATTYEVGKDGVYTLYAVWAPNTYTVHFDANGGTGTVDDQELTWIDDATDPGEALNANQYENSGFRFAGWAYTDIDGKAATATDEQVVKNLTDGDEITLTAQWEQVATITYNLNGAVQTEDQVLGLKKTKEVAAGSTTDKFTPPTASDFALAPTKTGYTLPANIVWTTEANGTGTTYAGGTEYTAENITGNVTLYLKWTEGDSDYLVVRWLQTFDANGNATGYEKEDTAGLTDGQLRDKGLLRTAATNSVVKFGDVKADLESKDADFYTLYKLADRMHDDDSVTVTPNTPGDGAINRAVLNVYYDRKPFTVHYEYTGDVPEGISAPADEQVVWGTPYTVAAKPAAVEGVTQGDWTAADASSNPVTIAEGALTMPQSNVTITLHFAVQTLTVKLESGDASLWQWDGASASVNYDTALGTAKLNSMVDKTNIDPSYDILDWDQYTQNDDGSRTRVAQKVDPASVKVKVNTVFVANLGKCYVVKWLPGTQGTFDPQSKEGAALAGTDELNTFFAAPVSTAQTNHNPGYQFKGWEYTLTVDAVDASGNAISKDVDPQTADKDGNNLPKYVNQNLTFTATWEPINQTIILDMNTMYDEDGNVVSTPATWAYASTQEAAKQFSPATNSTYAFTTITDKNVFLPSKAEMTTDDFELAGWTSEITGAKSAGVNIKMPANSDNSGAITMYPVVKEAKSQFTYTADPGSQGLVSKASDTVNRFSGTAATVTATAKELGYKFKEWTLADGSAIPAGSVEISGDHGNAITPQKGSSPAKYVASAAYKATFEARTMPVELVNGNGTLSSTSFPGGGLPFGTKIDAYLDGQSTGATFASSFAFTPEQGYATASPAWDVTVYEIVSIDDNDEPVFATTGTTTQTSDPGSIVAQGKMVITPRTDAQPATIAFLPNTTKYPGATGSSSFTGTTGSQFTAPADGFALTGNHLVGFTENTSGAGTVYKPGANKNDAGEPYTMKAGTTTMYAQYEPNKVTYVADLNGGTSAANPSGKLPSEQGTYGGRVTAPAAPADLVPPAPNKEFKGWAKADDATTPDYAEGVAITVPGDVADGSTITLYAVWGDAEYTLSYDGHGAQNASAMNDAFEDGLVWDETAGNAGTFTVAANAYERNGYEFKYFTLTAEDAGDEFRPGDTITLDDINRYDTVLYAQWRELGKYSVEFYVDGERVATVDDLEDTATFSGPAVTAEAGKAFKGWYTQQGGTGDKANVGTDTWKAIAGKSTATLAAGDPNTLQLFAKVVDLKVKLHVDPNDADDKDHPTSVPGTGAPEPDGKLPVTQAEPWDDDLTVPTATRPGYDLTGWKTPGGQDVSTGTPFQDILGSDPASGDDGTVDLTLIPQWRERTATIVYQTNDANAGLVSLTTPTSWVGQTQEANVKVATGTPVGAKAEAKPGFHFVNWTVNYSGALTPAGLTTQAEGVAAELATQDASSVYSSETSIMPGRDSNDVLQALTYTANFVGNDAGRITFDSNGGTGTVDPIDQTIGLPITLPDGDSLSREHYDFGGWQLPDGTTAQPGDTYTVPGDATVKAIWTPKTYKVTIPDGDDEGGKVDGGETQLPYGDKLPDDLAKATPADGKELVGWHVVVTDDDGNVIREETVNGPLSSITVDGNLTITPVWGDVEKPASDPQDDGKDDANGSTVAPADNAGTSGDSSASGTAATAATPAATAAVSSNASGYSYGSSKSPVTGDPLVAAMMGVGSMAIAAFFVLLAANRKRKQGAQHERR